MPANTSIKLRGDTKGIAGFAFFEHDDLTSIIIPKSVTNIGIRAFSSSLTSITFQGIITSDNLNISETLKQKYLAEGKGTYTRSIENHNFIWTKQPDSSNKTVSGGKSSGSVSSFPGRWRLIEGRGDAKDVELFKDGTGTADGNGITWKIENGRFHILHPFYTFSAYYNVTGSTVTFTQDDGKVIKYQKK